MNALKFFVSNFSFRRTNMPNIAEILSSSRALSEVGTQPVYLMARSPVSHVSKYILDWMTRPASPNYPLFVMFYKHDKRARKFFDVYAKVYGKDAALSNIRFNDEMGEFHERLFIGKHITWSGEAMGLGNRRQHEIDRYPAQTEVTETDFAMFQEIFGHHWARSSRIEEFQDRSIFSFLTGRRHMDAPA